MHYRNFSKTELDQAYNNTLAVKDSSDILADWNKRSARIAEQRPEHLDLIYGSNPRNRIDYFGTGNGGPLLVFIHGGYWQMRSKETFRCLADGPLARGMDVALIGYTLAPDASMHEIVAEVYSAVNWLCDHSAEAGGDESASIVISGWSAGGHLTAMCRQLAVTLPRISGLLPISGIFDLEPIRHSYLNEKLGLDENSAARFSPIHHAPEPAIPTIVAYGSAELPELQYQSQSYAQMLEEAGCQVQLLPLKGRNHFTILETLADPAGGIAEAALSLGRP